MQHQATQERLQQARAAIAHLLQPASQPSVERELRGIAYRIAPLRARAHDAKSRR